MDMRKKKLSSTASENANWVKIFGKQYGHFSKKELSFPITQKFYFSVSTPKAPKLYLEDIFAPRTQRDIQ